MTSKNQQHLYMQVIHGKSYLQRVENALPIEKKNPGNFFFSLPRIIRLENDLELVILSELKTDSKST